MKFVLGLVLGLFLFGASVAHAGPVGTFDVSGSNPGGNSGGYSGSVKITRTGNTYKVVWQVGNSQFIGTGIGASNVKGMVTFGQAAENDTAITVSYVSDNSFGLALFVEQPNGQWQGIWTYGGSETIGTENWTRR